jgi:hypothetical protein
VSQEFLHNFRVHTQVLGHYTWVRDECLYLVLP